MKKMLSVIILLSITMILMGVAVATDVNNTQTITKPEKTTTTTVEDSQEDDSTSTTSEYVDEGCCTTVVQGENNDSAVSFRRDNTAQTTLNVKREGNVVKQYKTQGSYFVHIMVSKTGWVMGSGGLEGDNSVRTIESNTLNMFNTNTITNENINRIFKIKRGSILSHYLIKSPNGTYRLMIKRDGRVFEDSGKLKPGQYLVVPNKIKYFKEGSITNFKDTQENMLKYSQNLSAHDRYGEYRRQILTYYFKNNIVNTTIKAVVSNDNGRHVGLYTSRYVDNVKTETRYISSGSIPVLDKYMDVDYFTFNIRKIRTNITSHSKTTKGLNVVLTANVTDEFGHNVNMGFVTVSINNKTLKHKNNSVVLVPVKNGKVSYNATLDDIWKSKKFTYSMNYQSNSIYDPYKTNNANINVANFYTLKTKHNSTVYYGGKICIQSNLNYIENKEKITDGRISYKINGKTVRNSQNETLYKKVKNGIVEYNYTFNSQYKAKKYTITTIYTNGVYKKEYNTTITIKKIPVRIINAKKSLQKKMIFFNAKLVDKNNKTVNYNTKVSVKINGKTLKKDNITRVFNVKNGKIKFKFTIPFKLKHGKHTLTIMIPELKETLSIRRNYTFRT